MLKLRKTKKLLLIVTAFVMVLQSLLVPIGVFADDSLVDVGVLDETDYSSLLQGGGTVIVPDKEYEYVESVLFNTAPQAMWNLAKNSGFNVTAKSTINGKSAVKLSTTGENAYPEIFFWNEKSAGGRSSNGNLFGNVNVSSYTGVRLYINKPQNGGYSKLSIMIGKMYTGYWSNSFYTYTLKLPKNAYEGYVYIPYSDFVNKEGASFNPSSGVNFIAFKFPENAKHKTDVYIGELSLFREVTDKGPDSAGIVSKGVGVSLDSSTDYMFQKSELFNNSNNEIWAKAKKSSLEVTTGIKNKKFVPSDAETSIKLSATGEKGYPEIYFWDSLNPAGNTANGLLFGSYIDIKDYEGIRVWLKADVNNPYSTVTLYLGKMFTGYWPSEEKGFFEYTVIIDDGFEGYVNIPFNLFSNKKGEQLKVEDFNFIGFKYNEMGAEKGDLYISNLSAYGKNNGSQDKEPNNGTVLKPDKKYEHVESVLFNTAPQAMWNLAKNSGFNVTAKSKINGKSVVKLSTTGEKAYPEIFFWNEKSAGGRSSNGNLFGNVDVSSYTGIRLYINKPQNGGYPKLSIMIGKMYTGYWSNSFYTYTLKLPQNAYEGYVYIPYSDFVNKEGASFNPSSGVNFIAFKFPENAKYKTDVYIGELSLFRKVTDKGPDSAGIVSKGVGVSLDSKIDYMLWDSVIFNNSTDKVWAKAKKSSLEVTTGIKNKKSVPSDAETSIKLSATGEKGYPEIYFWNSLYRLGNATNGLLFGSNINITDYEGIRVWLKADVNNPYSTVTLYLGKMFTGYWPSEEKGFFEYTVIIDDGFEGYVNIPFNLFSNKKGEQLKVEDFNFIGFKYNEMGAEKGDLYISNLSVYGKNNGSQERKVPIGVKLNENKKYELLPSKVFNAASQSMWDQSKINGIKVTTGIIDSKYIPENGKTSVKISTTGEKPSPEIYYWNENSEKGRCTQGRFWGDVDNTFYDGIRLWIKIDSNNTYSKLEIKTGQMFTGYWPKEAVGFYTYTVVIPRGGYEGYINIPFSAFVNNQGEALNAQFLNFIGFKYNESGFKETDMYISDLTLYREAKNGVSLSEDGKIIGGNKLPENLNMKLPSNEDVLGTLSPNENSPQNPNSQKNEHDGENIFILVTVILSVGVLITITTLSVIFKKRKNKKGKVEIK